MIVPFMIQYTFLIEKVLPIPTNCTFLLLDLKLVRILDFYIEDILTKLEQLIDRH